ncbi:hypothetical protein D3C81_1207860 [compost metagenome]
MGRAPCADGQYISGEVACNLSSRPCSGSDRRRGELSAPSFMKVRRHLAAARRPGRLVNEVRKVEIEV